MSQLFKNFVARLPTFLVLAILLLLISGCAASPNFLEPASPVASREANLFWILIGVSAVVFVIVEGLLIYNVTRFRRRGDQKGKPPQVYREHLIEIIYTAIPILIVIVLFILMMNTMQAVAAPPPQPGDLTLQVVGHRWWWEFDYPDLNIKTANERSEKMK